MKIKINIMTIQRLPSSNEIVSIPHPHNELCGDELCGDEPFLTITLAESIHCSTLINQCPHYERHCSLVAPCCDRIYVCHQCHDAKENHEINRKEVIEIVCRHCHTRQKLGKFCQGCQIEFAKYYCEECRIYDSLDRQQFHCSDCGLCRVGGVENFQHCQTCHMCVRKGKNHKCLENKGLAACPVCLELLFTSNGLLISELNKCGHMIHTNCLKKLIKYSRKCPHCQTTISDMTESNRLKSEHLQLFHEMIVSLGI